MVLGRSKQGVLMKKQKFSYWNRSPEALARSPWPTDASNRIFNGYFDPGPFPAGPPLSKGEQLYTMGSCFAREIEHFLKKGGYGVLSRNDKLLVEMGYIEGSGGPETGLFNRYNLVSMLQEFKRGAGDSSFDDDSALIAEVSGSFYDLNCHSKAARPSPGEIGESRRKLLPTVGRFREARAIIITLGLTECYIHTPSGAVCNTVPGAVMARLSSTFEPHVLTYSENLNALEEIHKCIASQHVDGNFNLIVTVSPVPLTHSFSEEDIVIANNRSKCVLRTVAHEFCATHANVSYFPSFEIVNYSGRSLAWQDDQIHVRLECVKHVVGVFSKRYLQAPPAGGA